MLFRWLLVDAAAEILVESEPPAGLLSPAETAFLAALRYPLRRRKWLAGRLAAKRLLAAILAEEHGEAPPLDSIVVANEPSGRPYAMLASVPASPVASELERRPYAVLADGKSLAGSLSISHRGDFGLAAFTSNPELSLGVDLETIEPRDRALVRGFFTAAEAAEVAAAVPSEVDLVVARIWSAKESVLKALGLGLRLDTRTVTVTAAHHEFATRQSPDAPGWLPLGVRVTLEEHGQPAQPAQPAQPERPGRPNDFRAFWRMVGEHLLTAAIARLSSSLWV
ncbi:MAG: 4'-phosphopantetheinyl transferase superfamily protein [Pseudomonadota bacterium]